MERDNWNNRNNRRYNDSWQDDNRRADPDSYRGAYRLDNNSEDRNKTTYNGFDSRDRDRDDSSDGNHYSNQNRSYSGDNRGWSSRSQNSYDNRNYGNRESDRYRDNRGSYRNEQYRPTNEGYSTRSEGGNFNGNYSPDRYGNSGGDNYGNMAGSLSFGYDGYNNTDPDWNRHYDPMSGRRRSYHGNDYDSRRPDFYNERDRRRYDDDFRNNDMF
ncbi:hypothetical protein [Pontibacter harenae]|uniref:hypothetical protein n=1 Tax=Pontibacter harenae TaxID=2894083 RepID=UPI001E646C8A|nr:hypothetical protein [Pontibacter harenae]MCC9167500.1 hypothetical protein [Pontibacter harenae]